MELILSGVRKYCFYSSHSLDYGTYIGLLGDLQYSFLEYGYIYIFVAYKELGFVMKFHTD